MMSFSQKQEKKNYVKEKIYNEYKKFIMLGLNRLFFQKYNTDETYETNRRDKLLLI